MSRQTYRTRVLFEVRSSITQKAIPHATPRGHAWAENACDDIIVAKPDVSQEGCEHY